MIRTKGPALAAASAARQRITLSSAHAATFFLTSGLAGLGDSCRRAARVALTLLTLSSLVQSSKVLAADSLTLSWTAPGDDVNSGRATEYDLRYSTIVIDVGNFSSATRFLGAPVPSPAGVTETCKITGLNSGPTYYFCIKTADEAGNWSEISNVLVYSSNGYICGDANTNGIVNITDVVSVISYIFAGGPAPSPPDAGDVNCDSVVSISDAVYLIAYLFSGGLAPCAACS